MPKRFVWKTLYFRTAHEAGLVLAAWKNFSRSPRHQLAVTGEVVETNLPWRALRSLLSFADVTRPREIATDVAPSWETEEDNAGTAAGPVWLPADSPAVETTLLVGTRPCVKTAGLLLPLLRAARRAAPESGAATVTPADNQGCASPTDQDEL